MLPEITTLEFDSEEIIQDKNIQSTFKWDFEKGDFDLVDGKLIELNGIEYIKVWIEKTLRTRKELEIYTYYGSDHHDIIGSVYDRDFVKSELTRMIKEALDSNSDILSVDDVTIEFEGSKLSITFRVDTIFGDAEVII